MYSPAHFQGHFDLCTVDEQYWNLIIVDVPSYYNLTSHDQTDTLMTFVKCGSRIISRVVYG